MSDAVIGLGAEFWLDSASNVLTKLGEVTNVPLPNEQVDDVEVTHYGSLGRTREYIAGMIDAGEGSIEMNYAAGSATDLLLTAAKADGVVRDYKVVIPTSSGTWEVTGQCYVKGYEKTIPIDDRLTATITVRFTGATTEAAGA